MKALGQRRFWRQGGFSFLTKFAFVPIPGMSALKRSQSLEGFEEIPATEKRQRRTVLGFGFMRRLFGLLSRIKPTLKRVLPYRIVKFLRYLLLNLPRALEKYRTRRLFMMASGSREYLDNDDLQALQAKYPFPPEYGYDAHAVEVRGKGRVAQLMRLPGAKQAETFLELGCWDAMVSCFLKQNGKEATAIDNRDSGFDIRAAKQGVKLLQMNAADMQFEDESFDFIFSYDAFEHFSSPETVLREAIRTVKKGGYIYLEFGPLYYSPFGEHAYESITVPYCQVLFQPAQLNALIQQKELKPIDYDHVNRWSLDDYRMLWQRYARVLKTVRYYEEQELGHLDLIRKYPDCFKSKSDRFDNFIVGSISVLFQKIDGNVPAFENV